MNQCVIEIPGISVTLREIEDLSPTGSSTHFHVKIPRGNRWPQVVAGGEDGLLVLVYGNGHIHVIPPEGPLPVGERLSDGLNLIAQGIGQVLSAAEEAAA